VVTLGPDDVAFQHDHKLYLAPLNGAERPVASRELPIGWTSRGLYTYRYPGRELLLRSDTGALVATLARRPLGSDYFVANGTLYFIVRGVLTSALGPQVRPLASLRSLHMSRNSMLQPTGPLLELEDNSRIVVLHPDGSLFASTAVPRSDRQPETISSGLNVSPNGNAVAFAAAAGESGDPSSARRAIGTETIYLLGAGSRKSVPVHTERVAFNPCERGAALAWHGKWVLYSNSEGNLVAIDTARSRRAIDLSGLVRGLLGTQDFFDAHWG
jgi:hypothetical protein